MSDLAAPRAKRLQRPSWRDSRLLVGLLLALAAATLGARIVASADDRVGYFVAAGDLVAGDRVSATSFKRVDVALAEGMSAYLAADAAAPEGKVLLRDLRAGELVPSSALGSIGEVAVQQVTVRADSMSTRGLADGQRVDGYVTPKDSTRAPAEPQAQPQTHRLLEAVAVISVLDSGGGLGSSAATSVQLYVPTEKVQAAIEAVDSGAKVTLVPVAGALGKARDA
jgi:hypothetical protein